MDEIQIQQLLKKSLFFKILTTILLAGFLSSCVQLRYTDYGRPLDFLKSKNHYYKHATNTVDTANVYEFGQNYDKHSIEQKSEEVFVSETIKIDSLPLDQNSIDNITISDNSTYQVKLINHKPLKINDRKINTKPLSTHNTVKANIKNRGPGWWESFWKGFWNFVLKWLLIFLCFFILLALAIWGIYLLITLVAGSVAASIFLVIVLTLLYILFQ